MVSRYDENTKARAVRLVREHGGDYETQWAATKAIPARLGMSAETLRKWVGQAEVDAGVMPGVPTQTAQRYLEQAALSLRPNTVRHTDLDLRRFGARLPDTHPDVTGCADLRREHIEAPPRLLGVDGATPRVPHCQR
jgi:transposase-like protein